METSNNYLMQERADFHWSCWEGRTTLEDKLYKEVDITERDGWVTGKEEAYRKESFQNK